MLIKQVRLDSPDVLNDAREVCINNSMHSSKKEDQRVCICGRLCEMFLASSLITMQNLVDVSHTVSVHVGGLNLEDAQAPPLGTGA